MEYLTGPQVKQRYKISESTLGRWIKDEDVAFPKPMVINRRKFFAETDLSDWEQKKRTKELS